MPPVRVAFADDATTDLEELADYLDARNPVATVKVRDAIFAAVAMLASPGLRVEGPAVTLRSGAPCRRHFVRPVVLSSRREGGVLTVIRACHQAREPVAR